MATKKQLVEMEALLRKMTPKQRWEIYAFILELKRDRRESESPTD